MTSSTRKIAEILIILKLAPFAMHLLLFHIQWGSGVLSTKQEEIKGWGNISEYRENTIVIDCVNNVTMVENYHRNVWTQIEQV